MNWLSLRTVRLMVAFAAMTLLSACGSETVVQDQTQRDATEIVALLNNHGIVASANKERGGKARFAVEVRRGYYAQALSLLAAKGYPRDPQPSFADIVAEKGLLPSSSEMEALRIDHALALEIEELIRNRAEVSDAKVVVRSRFVRDIAVPSVAAMVQVAKAGKSLEQELRAIIVSLVPGITQDQVHLTLQAGPSDEIVSSKDGVMTENGRVIPVPLVTFLFGWHVAASDVSGMALAMLACVLIVLAVGLLVGYWYGFYQNSRRLFQRENGDVLSGARSSKLERSRKEPPPSV